MPNLIPFHNVARLPMPDDNVAIATQRLEVGTEINHQDEQFRLNHTVLEGHRFAIKSIATGEALLSWGLPFGQAIQAIEPGHYVCNAGMLEALAGRRIDFALPATANFADNIQPFVLDEATFVSAPALPRYEQERTFLGYRRNGGRGVGTRNYIILLGTTSRTGSFVKQLETRLKDIAIDCPNIDGIVAVAHTEGDVAQPNNRDLLLRTLAGFMTHPNVGAVLAVDYGLEAINNEILRTYLLEQGYPLNQVLHHFLSLNGGFEASLASGQAVVEGWLDQVNGMERAPESVANLKIALQCGGSDAFSGVSGNPLAAWVAKEVIRYGGSANLAETDELIGAEPYALQKVRDLPTAKKFLGMIERFKERVSWHGTTAEGNPSGGNKFRGLYNISLKSIGAAMKRHPDVRLDAAIEYGEPMTEPGYYFMDSPGNDLESIAGQIASGCNVIFFVTGNGSITNFPFAPTLKIVTTSHRFEMLDQDMDVNAGRYLDGMPMNELGQEMFDQTIAVASGTRSVGEQAGHAQVQIWRDWAQSNAQQLEVVLDTPAPNGASIPIDLSEIAASPIQFQAVRTDRGVSLDQVGLILPTSLCSGQIAKMTVNQLNQQALGQSQGLSRFVSLVHTEGCGVAGKTADMIYNRTLLGYLTHPLVKHCLLLEHGCEKTHNDYMRNQLTVAGVDAEQFGWASIQLDGGIEAVMEKIEGWFVDQVSQMPSPEFEDVGLENLRVGVINAGQISASASRALAQFTQIIVGAGGTVVVPQLSDLLADPGFRDVLQLGKQIPPSLTHSEQFVQSGFHVMETPSGHWIETLTGMAATGVELIVAHLGTPPMPGHPLVPVIQITADETIQQRFAPDLDLMLREDTDLWPEQILEHLIDVIEKRHQPKLTQQGNVDFQISRGLLGVSM